MQPPTVPSQCSYIAGLPLCFTLVNASRSHVCLSSGSQPCCPHRVPTSFPTFLSRLLSATLVPACCSYMLLTPLIPSACFGRPSRSSFGLSFMPQHSHLLFYLCSHLLIPPLAPPFAPNSGSKLSCWRLMDSSEGKAVHVVELPTSTCRSCVGDAVEKVSEIPCKSKRSTPSSREVDDLRSAIPLACVKLRTKKQ